MCGAAPRSPPSERAQPASSSSCSNSTRTVRLGRSTTASPSAAASSTGSMAASLCSMTVECDADPLHRLGRASLERPHVRLEPPERADRRRRHDRGRATPRREDCDLADDVPRSHVSEPLFSGCDDRRTGLDDEEAVTEVALGREGVALGELDLRRGRRERVELLLGEPREERDSREAPAVHSTTLTLSRVAIWWRSGYR